MRALQGVIKEIAQGSFVPDNPRSKHFTFPPAPGHTNDVVGSQAMHQFKITPAAKIAPLVKSEPLVISDDEKGDGDDLNLNVCTALRRDTNNHSDFNLLCPLSDFQNGEVWFASPTGTVPSLDASRNSLGHLLSLRQPAWLPAKACLHETRPWTGDRLILIAYGAAKPTSLPQCDREFLSSLGFPRPDSHTGDPPTSVPQPVPDAVAQSRTCVQHCFHDFRRRGACQSLQVPARQVAVC